MLLLTVTFMLRSAMVYRKHPGWICCPSFFTGWKLPNTVFAFVARKPYRNEWLASCGIYVQDRASDKWYSLCRGGGHTVISWRKNTVVALIFTPTLKVILTPVIVVRNALMSKPRLGSIIDCLALAIADRERGNFSSVGATHAF